MRFKRKTAAPAAPGKNITKIRWLAWLLICALAVFFSEVVSGRTPAVFINVYGLLVVCMLYFLHLMVLLPFIFRSGRAAMPTLYLAGALFGLYEAYITKRLWSPADVPGDVFAGGVAVFTTLMLVFFWHPVMSVIVPLFTADGLLNSHRNLKIPIPFRRLRRVKPVFLFLAAGVALGLIHGTAVGRWNQALFSAVSSTLIIWVLLRIWKSLAGRTVFTLNQLLPNARQWRLFLLVLAADIIALGFTLRFDALPAWPGHVIVIALYALIIALLAASLKTISSPLLQPAGEDAPVYLNISPKGWLMFSAAFTLISAGAAFLPAWAKEGVFYAVWGICIAAGLVFFGWSVVKVFPKGKLRVKLLDLRGFFYVLQGRLRARFGSLIRASAVQKAGSAAARHPAHAAPKFFRKPGGFRIRLPRPDWKAFFHKFAFLKRSGGVSKT